MFCFFLAEHLHKTLDEIFELTTFEIQLWSAYLDIRNQQQIDASNKYKNQRAG
tara:strand:- start:1871 stop:2029 length:159 start_codon:yes stop_codon:yes gene_type:complete